MSYEGQGGYVCGGAIGGADGVDDAGSGKYEGRRCLYRCAYGREYPWEQHGCAGVDVAAGRACCPRVFEIAHSGSGLVRLPRSIAAEHLQLLTSHPQTTTEVCNDFTDWISCLRLPMAVVLSHFKAQGHLC
jgi:hypothetical protein